MRLAQISGRVANFGQHDKVRTTGEGEKNDAFAVRFLNVSMDRKDEDTGYTKTEAMKVMAFGYTAERLMSFGIMENVVATGKFEKENDYVNNEGETIPGGWFIRLDQIDNWPEKKDNDENTAEAKAKPAKKDDKKAAPKKAAKPSLKRPKTA